MQSAISIKPVYRPWAVILTLLAAVTLQSLHFYFYYEQTAANSIVWSLVDWSAWFFVIAFCHYGYGRVPKVQRGKYYWPAFVAVVILAGPLQIILSNSVYGLISEPARPFVEDLLHLYDKRWLQNMLYAGLLWQLFNILWPLKPKAVNEGAIKVTDGKTVHWLKASDIHYVEAARNYLSLHLEGREILIRKPLKDFMARLPQGAFIRISRSHLVNVAQISRIEPYSKHSKQVVLKDGANLQIGRTYLPEIKKALAH